MPMLNALFILALCFLGFGVYCFVAIPIWLVTGDKILCRRGSPNRKVIGLLAVSIVYVISLWAYYLWATRPAAVFEMAFGFKPPADVEIQSSSHSVLGDHGEQSLSFTATPATIDRILKNRFETSLNACMPNTDGSFSFSREFSDSFLFETEDLQYNRRTSKARYHWVGID